MTDFGSVTLSDNSKGLLLRLNTSLQRGLTGQLDSTILATCVQDRVWIVEQGSTFASVRDARTGALQRKIDLLDEAVAIATVPCYDSNNRALNHQVWVSVGSGKLYIFGEEGTLLGLLQPFPEGMVGTCINNFYPMPLEAPNIVFSSSKGKDVVLWDTLKFSIIRSYFGKVPGEEVTGVCALDPEASLFVVSSTSSIRVWSRNEAAIITELEASILAIVVDYSMPPRAYDSSKFKSNNLPLQKDVTGTLVGYIWAAQRTQITIYAVVVTIPVGTAIDSDMSQTHYTQLPTIALFAERTLPCPGANQLVRATPSHVVAVDEDGLVSIWDTTTFTPMRSFDVTKNFQGKGRFLVVPTVCRTSRLLWTIGSNDSTLLWSDEADLEGDAFSNGLSGPQLVPSFSEDIKAKQGAVQTYVSKDMEREEIAFLRRKLRYLETMSSLYRQKVANLVREKGAALLTAEGQIFGPSHRKQYNDLVGVASQKISTAFNEIDMAYEDALAKYSSQTIEQEPLPDQIALSQKSELFHSDDPTMSSYYKDYWKNKCKELHEEIALLRKEFDSIMELFLLPDKSDATDRVQGERDIRRAQHLCDLLRERNEARQKEKQLAEDVQRLRIKLREFNSPLASPGPVEDMEALHANNAALKEEVLTLTSKLDEAQKENQQLRAQAKAGQLLKGRVSKMQQLLDESEVKFSDRTSEMQADIDKVVAKLFHAEKEAEKARCSLYQAQTEKQNAERQAQQHRLEQERLQAALKEADLRNERVVSAEAETQQRLKKEIEDLVLALGTKKKRLNELEASLSDAILKQNDVELENSSLRNALLGKDAEKEALLDRIRHFESIIGDRRQYAQIIVEVQGRIESLLEELRTAFTPGEFSRSIEALEGRMSGLLAVEQELRHKDDIIAARDDEILLLKQNAEALSKEISTISSVFLQLPRSVEEVEGLMIEVDEYRRRLGMPQEVQQIVRQRMLELYAKRRRGEDITVTDIDNFAAAGKSDGSSLTTLPRSPDAEALSRARVLAETLRNTATNSLSDQKAGLLTSAKNLESLSKNNF